MAYTLVAAATGSVSADDGDDDNNHR